MVTRRHALGGITTGAIGAGLPLAGNMAAAATGAKPAASAAHATGPEGELELVEVQPPGGRPMPYADYLRGRQG